MAASNAAPELASVRLFIVAKGYRGQWLIAAGLCRTFRYHRQIGGVSAWNPHVLPHISGTALPI